MSSGNDTPLAKVLIEIIKRQGPILVSDFMHQCLYAPRYGYYKSGLPLGREGDFITAPEISQVFGELLAIWGHLAWQNIGMPKRYNLIELGPGRGTLMADMLRTISNLNVKIKPAPQIDVHLIESSITLRQSQQQQLTPFLSSENITCYWHEDLSQVSAAPSVLIANEFLDCLPIKQFIFYDGEWCERLVGLDEKHNLDFVIGNPVDPSQIPATFRGKSSTTKTGSIWEQCPGFTPLMQTLAEFATRSPIMSLFIDYGFSGPLLGESLQAVANHKAVPVFNHPGECDLTVHVDFNALSLTAEQAGLSPSKMMTQGQFLSHMGIGPRAERLIEKASEAQIKIITTGILRLVAEEHMGNLFKVMAISSKDLKIIPPFID